MPQALGPRPRGRGHRGLVAGHAGRGRCHRGYGLSRSGRTGQHLHPATGPPVPAPTPRSAPHQRRSSPRIRTLPTPWGGAGGLALIVAARAAARALASAAAAALAAAALAAAFAAV